MDAVAIVRDVPKAAIALKPLRLRILQAAQAPASAAAIAASLGLSRQAVNYHVRALARAGFLRKAGRERKRGLIEQKYVVSARAFLLAPNVLGPLDAGPAESADRSSVAYLLMLAARMQQEAGHAWRAARKQGKRVPILAIDSEIAFDSPAERAAFAEALSAAIARVIAEHTSPPAPREGGRPTRRYRLALGCYPL
jgi:biotin operon repressor